MKCGIVVIAVLFCSGALGQTAINKAIAVQKGQQIKMHFDYPRLIRVSTWDKNEISVQGTVDINGGENNDAFVLQNATEGNVVTIRSQIKDIESLPKRVTIYHKGQKLIFKDKAEWKKYQQEHGTGYNTMSTGPEIDIALDIKVPRNTTTTIESVYGLVEIKNFDGPLTVEATYGGVDAALTEAAVGEVVAETNYGEIFTNLNAKFGGDSRKEEAFHTLVKAKPGSGPNYNLESKYGNVYIRKALQ